MCSVGEEIGYGDWHKLESYAAAWDDVKKMGPFIRDLLKVRLLKPSPDAEPIEMILLNTVGGPYRNDPCTVFAWFFYKDKPKHGQRLLKLKSLDPNAGLNAYNTDYNPLVRAIDGRNLRLVKRLVKRGMNVNLRMHLYGSIIANAALFGSWGKNPSVPYLLRNGVDLNLPVQGNTDFFSFVVETMDNRIENVIHLTEFLFEKNDEKGWYKLNKLLGNTCKEKDFFTLLYEEKGKKSPDGKSLRKKWYKVFFHEKALKYNIFSTEIIELICQYI
jgi:hypothetical protein